MSFGSKEKGYAPVITINMLLSLAVVCGLIGWCVIELILWLFSFVHISFGG